MTALLPANVKVHLALGCVAAEDSLRIDTLNLVETAPKA